MSREVRRVPLGFQWPMNKVWKGYVTPRELRLPDCPACSGSGYTPAASWVNTLLSRLSMLCRDVAEQELGRAMHPWLAQDRYPPTREVRRPVTENERLVARLNVAAAEDRGVAASPRDYQRAEDESTEVAGYEVLRPTRDILELARALAGEERARYVGDFGSTDTWHMAKNLYQLLGLPEDWDYCKECGGSGSGGTPEQRAARDAWEWEQPPSGEGWQYWETVSEGSPISPVFSSAEDLVVWLSTEYTYGSQNGPLTRAQAEAVVDAGGTFASGVMANGVFMTGEEAVLALAEKDPEE
jgi:hypothetical protein